MKSRPHPRKYVQKLALRKPCEHGPTGVELRPHQVVIRPLVTEKGTHQSTRYNAYAFQVNVLATKDQIKDAVQELFNVKVEAVRTMTRKGKVARYRNSLGKQSTWKRALVTLDPESKIEFF